MTKVWDIEVFEFKLHYKLTIMKALKWIAYLSAGIGLFTGNTGISIRCFPPATVPCQIHGKLLPGSKQLLPDYRYHISLHLICAGNKRSDFTVLVPPFRSHRLTVLFNSFEYFLFLPAVVLIYFLLPYRWRNPFLLIASYYFYMSLKWEFGFLLLFTSLVNYFAGLKIQGCYQSEIAQNCG